MNPAIITAHCLHNWRSSVSATALALLALSTAVLAQNNNAQNDNSATPQAGAPNGSPCGMPPGGPGGPPPDGTGGPPPDNAGGPPPEAPGDSQNQNANGAPQGPPPGASDQQGSQSGSGGQAGPGGPGEPPPGGPCGGQQASIKLSGVFTASKGESKSESGKSYASGQKDTSAVYAFDGGSIALDRPTITTSGNSSSQDSSSFFGLNAGVLAANGGKIAIHGGSISTTGTGANGAFASGNGSEVELTDVTIKATAGGGHGLMTAGGGKMKLTNVNIDTAGQSGAAIATDRGGGVIVAEGGTIKTSGFRSPSIYSTGEITVSHATMLSTGAECAVIEGSNTITVIESAMTCEKSWGAMLYQSFSGDAQGQESHFTMHGGSLSVKTGPVFFVNNTHGTINLSGVKLTSASGVLLSATTAQWGRQGANGGKAILIADQQELPGDLIAGGGGSSIDATLKNHSSLNGAVQGASLTLDATSQWNVSSDSKLAGLADPAGVASGNITNIVGNGHTVTYKAGDARNAWLGGKSYQLTGGGKLIPEN
jgi:hypothetical protein